MMKTDGFEVPSVPTTTPKKKKAYRVVSQQPKCHRSNQAAAVTTPVCRFHLQRLRRAVTTAGAWWRKAFLFSLENDLQARQVSLLMLEGTTGMGM
jgi:hypothetical protein